jgi:outer membrane protein OmpA-like peptidoglycan-associated protein
MTFPTLTRSMTRILPLILIGSPLFGCASSQAPKELVDARAAYTQAQGGYAKDLSPAELHEAKVALDSAERSFSADGDSQITRDQAYVATRKAEQADAVGATQHFQRELEATKQRQTQQQAKAAERATTELSTTRQELVQEKSAREAADQRARQALEQLSAANTNVKHEERGTVITLPGNVLFASGKSVLMPGAQSSLNQVADALKNQGEAKILVEGHTDSTGSIETNMALSKARADSVGSYLTSRGVPSDQVTTNGLGPSRPVADNTSPEGRANNRRVEIVIQSVEPR